MIYFFTPYSKEKRLFEAIASYMALLHDPDDWVCLSDGDTMFLQPDFGHILDGYIQRYPDTGLFTCYASRCHYDFQLPPGAQPENPSILFHRELAKTLEYDHMFEVEEVQRRIAGHLMMFSKRTWHRIAMRVRIRCEAKNILGVDTKISNEILNQGMKIRLMKSVYVMHYLRFAEGIDNKTHLEP